SAIKIGGRSAYRRMRAGESVQLNPRPVNVTRFEALQLTQLGEFLDVEVIVECSSGTYVRALARDLGAALRVGGHLTALRRTRVGAFTLAEATPLADLPEDPVNLPLAAAAARFFPRRDATPDEARVLGHGGPLAA